MISCSYIQACMQGTNNFSTKIKPYANDPMARGKREINLYYISWWNSNIQI